MTFSNSTHSTTVRRQAGFTLLESAIALLVLSIGLLGIGALFVDGLKSGRTAVYRTTAIYLASDMADRIRSNPLAGAAYENAAAEHGCRDDDATCSPTQLAEQDTLTWINNLTEHMPANAAGAVAVDNNGVTTEYTVNITWPEPGLEDVQVYDLVFEL